MVDQRILHINCGGDNIVITKYSHKITYQADNSKTKAATNQQFKDWGISNTGEFFSDGNSKAATSNTDDTYIISTNLTLPGVSPCKKIRNQNEQLKNKRERVVNPESKRERE